MAANALHRRWGKIGFLQLCLNVISQTGLSIILISRFATACGQLRSASLIVCFAGQLAAAAAPSIRLHVQADIPQTLEALYFLHSKDLLRFLTARIGDPREAEDVLQELWIRLHRVTNTPIDNARAYLFRMAQNLVVDRIREKQRRMRRENLWLDGQGQKTMAGESVDPTLSAEDAMIAREETIRLAGAVATMPAGARRVFELHKQDGLSHAEVAIQLGISKSGVEKHMAVAMKYIRRAFRD